MLEEISELIGLQVYSPDGIFLGNVDNLVMDLDREVIDGLYISESNPLLVEDSQSINIPYRWVQAVGDVVILRYFPQHISSEGKPPEDEDAE